jgi:hypothetical protein
MRFAGVAPERLAGAVLNDVGPELSKVGLERVAGYAGRMPEIADWAGAADYARAINGVAFPDYADADWMAFARRIFREDETGRPRLDYDPSISIARLPPDAPPQPSAWPAFERLADGRPLLLVRGAISDLLTAESAAEMRRRAPHMAYAEVPRVGHAPMLTEPSAQAAIAAFLEAAP